MLALAITVKLLAEIALLVLLGQGIVGLMSGAARNRNSFYRVLQVAGRPWVRVARFLSPRVVLDVHLPLVAFLILLLVWGGATVAKVTICIQLGVASCK